VAEARGPAGFDLVACFREAQDLLFSYGGHKQAAGFSISLENIPVFQTRARAFAERTLKPEDVLPVLTIETVLPVESWNAETLGEIERLQPFGAGNPEPVFSSSGVALEGVAGGALTCRGRTDLTVVVARRDAREARPGELGGGRSSDVAYRLRRDRQNSVLVLLEDWRPSSQ
jgi:single-stranded DNA-specific DHH superfamily exonuclease